MKLMTHTLLRSPLVDRVTILPATQLLEVDGVGESLGVEN
jgi:hypothetical protein